MNYSNELVRRQDRLLAEAPARELLHKGEYGVLSMQCPDGLPYGLPINYVWDGQQSIYLHVATEGKKLDCIDAHPHVSFCIVGHTRVLSEQFTTEYESVILQGVAYRQLPDDERWRALAALLEKYSPADKERGLSYAQKSFGRTEIIRIDLGVWSGKTKRPSATHD